MLQHGGFWGVWGLINTSLGVSSLTCESCKSGISNVCVFFFFLFFEKSRANTTSKWRTDDWLMVMTWARYCKRTLTKWKLHHMGSLILTWCWSPIARKHSPCQSSLATWEMNTDSVAQHRCQTWLATGWTHLPPPQHTPHHHAPSPKTHTHTHAPSALNRPVLSSSWAGGGAGGGGVGV